MLKEILIIFSLIYILANMILFFVFFIRAIRYIKNQQAKTYIIAPATNIVFGVVCIIIALGNFVVIITTKQMIQVLFIAICLQIVNNIFIESILIVSKKTIFIKNIILDVEEINTLEYKKTFIFSKLIILKVEYENSKTIIVFISKKGKLLITNIVDNIQEKTLLNKHL